MSTTTQAITRTLVAAAFALAGTVASLSLTLSPAQAGAVTKYSAKLSAPISAPARKVVNGVVWNCTGDSCNGAIDGARPLNTCVQVVKAFGKLSTFTTPKGDFTADQLQQCNAAA